MTTRIAALAALVALSTSAQAQVRASELSSFTQMIDGTKISITYSRPRARGRDTLFGSRKSVRWGEVWTPGANFATTFEINRPVRIDGHPVKAGAYSVWMVVRQSGDWTMVLDPKVRIYHMDPPDSNANQVRWAVRPHDAPYLDVLTWSMPELRPSGGMLTMQWGRTRVDMNLDVEPSFSVTMARADAEPYLGAWEYSEIDSTGKAGSPHKFTIDYENNTLKGRWEMDDRYFKHFAMIRIAPDWFSPGIYDKGEVYEVLKPEIVLEFKRDQGRATSFTGRDDQDKLILKGRRLQ